MLPVLVVAVRLLARPDVAASIRDLRVWLRPLAIYGLAVGVPMAVRWVVLGGSGGYVGTGRSWPLSPSAVPVALFQLFVPPNGPSVRGRGRRMGAGSPC